MRFRVSGWGVGAVGGFVTIATMGAALVGCPKSDAPAADAGAAPVASALPSASAAPTATIAVDTASFTGALRGTLDTKHPIVMHLVQTSGALDGYYYYVPSIDDLKVHGTVSAAGVVHLDETSNGKPSGSFDGKLDGHDSLDGTWSDPKKSKSLPFHLDLVRDVQNAAATIVERKQKSKSKPAKAFDKTQWSGDPTCDLDVAFPDILGAITPPVEEIKIDKQLRDNAISALSPCEQPFTYGASYTIRQNGAGVFSVEQPQNNFGFGMPHASYGTTYTNIVLPSGKAIALKDILTPAGITLVGTRIQSALPSDVDADTRAMIKSTLASSAPDFSIDKSDLRVSVFNQLPHGYQGAAPTDLVIGEKDIDTMRVKPSPLDTLWGK